MALYPRSSFFLFLLFWLMGCATAPLASVAQAAPERNSADDSSRVLSTYRFIITHLPANTPADAGFYLVGSFNNWQPADARYRFQLQPNGLFGLVLRTRQARLECKVSRGYWAAIEGSGTYLLKSQQFDK